MDKYENLFHPPAVTILSLNSNKRAGPMINKYFIEHPNSIGENYFQHMASAFSFSARMLASGLACLIHGFFPFLFVRTGSATIIDLHHGMVTHRDRRAGTAVRV